jgi:hypothetical protein
VTVTVRPVPVRRIQVDTTPRRLAPGDSVTLTAIAVDSAGQPLAGRAIVFTAAAGNTGTLAMTQAAGGGGVTVRVRAVRSGSASLVAITEDDVRAVVPITVGSGSLVGPAASVEVFVGFRPRSVALGVGKSIDLPATLTTADGDTLATRGVTYATDDPSVATVDATGRVTMRAPERRCSPPRCKGGRRACRSSPSPRRRARSGSTSGWSAPRTRRSPRPRAPRRRGGRRWSPHLRPRRACSSAPGSAGPARRRSTSRSPTSSCSSASTASTARRAERKHRRLGGAVRAARDERPVGRTARRRDQPRRVRPAQPAAAGTTVEMIAHEIGHVLGIGPRGTSTPAANSCPASAAAGTTTWVRSAARAAFDLGFTATAAALPVEDGGGGGTRGAHWRERVFFTELMTGYLDFSPTP